MKNEQDSHSKLDLLLTCNKHEIKYLIFLEFPKSSQFRETKLFSNFVTKDRFDWFRQNDEYLVSSTENLESFINSRPHQPAIIALLFFLQFKEFELYWGRCLFYDSKRSIGEVLFLNQIYWSEF